jgi:hypothetical protein
MSSLKEVNYAKITDRAGRAIALQDRELESLLVRSTNHRSAGPGDLLFQDERRIAILAG